MQKGEPHAFKSVDTPAGSQQLGESITIAGQRRVSERDPVSIDVLLQQSYCEHAVSHQCSHLGQDVRRTAVNLLTPQRRNDAEVTTFLQPKDIKTQAAQDDSRHFGSANGNCCSTATISTWATLLWSVCSSRVNNDPKL